MGLDVLFRPGRARRFVTCRKAALYVLDFRFAGRATTNRWNYAGEPTLYLARDRGVAIGEFARHLQERRAPPAARQIVARQLFGLRLAVDRVLDLTSPGSASPVATEWRNQLSGRRLCPSHRALHSGNHVGAGAGRPLDVLPRRPQPLVPRRCSWRSSQPILMTTSRQWTTGESST